MRLAFALLCYSACFLFLWAVYGTPEWEALSHGYPSTPRELDVALIVAFAMLFKLGGHISLMSTSRAR